jgi:hypothetical protein
MSCTKCGSDGPFGKRTSGKPTSWCVACLRRHGKAWREKNADKKKHDARSWYERNKDKTRAAARAWNKANPEKAKAASRRWHEKNPNAKREQWHRRRGTKIGWPSHEFDRAWLEQAGRCEICGIEMTLTGTGARSVARDHDHATGARRDLLCFSCNKAIGLLGDSPDRVQRALAYLLKHRS